MSNNLLEGALVASLYRYPVKSMLGEALIQADITAAGVAGDRLYALIDSSDGKAASAKNPRKWPNLFAFRATLKGHTPPDLALAALQITLPDGTIVTGEQPHIDLILSRATGREVTLRSRHSMEQSLIHAEEFVPGRKGLPETDLVDEFTMPRGTFFDGAVIHLLTSATLDRLYALYPGGRFEAPRFRPNIVVNVSADKKGFVENDWIGQTLRIGPEVCLHITRPCQRCIMTTLPQGDLPKDPGILQTVARHNNASAGVYATVLQGGTVRLHDTIRIG